MNTPIPKPTEPVSGPGGLVNVNWYNFLQGLLSITSGEDVQAQIDAINAQLAQLGGSAEIRGPQSVAVGGSLADGLVQLRLVNDRNTPEATSYYGTDATGAKGWNLLALSSLADVDLAGLADGDAILWDATEEKWKPGAPEPPTRYVSVAMSDMVTTLTTGAGMACWFAPEDGELTSVFIGVNAPSTSGVVRVDMNDSGGSVFTTRPAIDASESTSLTGTNAVLDGAVSFSRGDKFTFDIDDAGTDAAGLQICIQYAPQ